MVVISFIQTTHYHRSCGPTFSLETSPFSSWGLGTLENDTGGWVCVCTCAHTYGHMRRNTLSQPQLRATQAKGQRVTSTLPADAPYRLLGLHASMKRACSLEAWDAGNGGLQLETEDGNTAPEEQNPANSHVSFEVDPSSAQLSDETPAWWTSVAPCVGSGAEKPAKRAQTFQATSFGHQLHSN